MLKGLSLAILFAAATAGGRSVAEEFELAPIHYSKTPARDALSSRLDAAGRLRLQSGHEASDTVRALLHELAISPASQVLVFSKTSLQRAHISPANPRALFFNDDVYLGWVPGGAMEVAAMDPDLGPVFHLVEFDGTAGIKARRDNECLSCHGGSRTGDIPGLMVRSVPTDPAGEPAPDQPTFVTTTTSPIDERWGGWYVTGAPDNAPHLGNQWITPDHPRALARAEAVDSLDRFFRTAPYPAATSDVLALMVLEHQVEVHNRLTAAMIAVRRGEYRRESMRRELGIDIAADPAGSYQSVLEAQTRLVTDAIFFRGEAALPDGGIEGAPAFKTAFKANAKRDEAGRSLKDFHLLDRLFKYRCSYLVYTPGFTRMPEPLRGRVLTSMLLTLTSRDPENRQAHLGPAERRAILEILVSTLPDLPGEWRAAAGRK
jgi:hypothetical protein